MQLLCMSSRLPDAQYRISGNLQQHQKELKVLRAPKSLPVVISSIDGAGLLNVHKERHHQAYAAPQHHTKRTLGSNQQELDLHCLTLPTEVPAPCSSHPDQL